MRQGVSHNIDTLPVEEKLEDAEEKDLTSLITKVVQKVRAGGNYIPEAHVTFMGQLLRVMDYNVDQAADLAVNCRDAILILYNEVRDYEPAKHYNMFGPSGIFKVLKRRDQIGRKIVLMHWGRWRPEDLSYDQAIAALLLLFQWILKSSPVTQRMGVVLLNDMNGFGMKQARATNMSMLKKVVPLAQTNTPAKVEGVHYIYTPRIFDFLFCVIKPFLNDRLGSRVHFHSNINTVFQHMSAEILPKSMGGTMGETDALDHELHKTFTDGGAEFVRQFVLDAVAEPVK